MLLKKNTCCSCSDGCCSSSNNNKTNKRELIIDFLYLDLTVCDRCQDTDKSLDEAISDAAKVLEATGIAIFIISSIFTTYADIKIIY
jgi:hypothetical protein